jgi:hypothetical protein
MLWYLLCGALKLKKLHLSAMLKSMGISTSMLPKPYSNRVIDHNGDSVQFVNLVEMGGLNNNLIGNFVSQVIEEYHKSIQWIYDLAAAEQCGRLNGENSLTYFKSLSLLSISFDSVRACRCSW